MLIDYPLDPTTIATGSFAIIRQELKEAGYSFEPAQTAVIERVIHSTADFDFAEITQFSPDAVEIGALTIRRGCTIVTDVNMVRVGISTRRLEPFSGSVHCFVATEEVRQRAEAEGTTRSAIGMRHAAEQGLLDGGIAVIGNAPTALYEVIDLIHQGLRPALVIGVPVGFVSTVESKAALSQVTAVPWIVTTGRKGGSPVAVAIVNALLRLAAEAPATAVD